MESVVKPYIVKIIGLLVAVVIFGACQPQDRYEAFGAEITETGAVDLETLQKELTTKDSVSTKLVAEIEDVCQMKGCWMTLKTADGSSVRVTFKDYGFFVPKDARGRQVILEGIATSQQLDQETAEHYAEDAGKELPADADLRELSIVASGVLIKKDEEKSL